MNLTKFNPLLIGSLALAISISSCKKDDDQPDPDPGPTSNITVPTTYNFERNGSSSVSYGGQTDRLNQLGELKAMLQKGDKGEKIEAQMLLDMFENKNDNGGGHFSFTSSKQLKNKTFDLDVAWFEDLLKQAAIASDSGLKGVVAKDGTAGLATRGKGSTILVDANGREFTQLVEKGLMGATFLNQIFNSYLTDDKIGTQVDNENIVDGKNYTTMEHHMDEAFGYFGAPIDFSSNYQGAEDPIYWAKYSNSSDDLTGSSDMIMKAFRTGRAAIVAKEYDVLNKSRALIYLELEKLAAATAIHYANSTLAADNDGDRLHALSECYAFIQALRYQDASHRKLTQSQVNDLLDNQIGTNFWKTTTTGLNTIKDVLSKTYLMEDIKDQL